MAKHRIPRGEGIAATSPASRRASEAVVRAARAAFFRLSLSLVLLVAAAQAGAQEKSDKNKYGTFRLGPFYLSVLAPFNVGVDDNVYNSPDDPVADRSASITPTLQVVLPMTRHARIRASGGIVPQYFHREASERFTDLFGDVRGEVDLGPITAFGGMGEGRYRQRFTMEIDERVQRHQSTEVFGATLHMGRRLTMTASQLRTTSTVDPEATLDGGNINEFLDRRTVTRRVELGVPITRKTTLLPFVDFITDEFLHPSPDLARTVDSARYGLGLSFSDLAFFNGTAFFGIRHYGAGQGVPPYNGPFLGVNLGSPFILNSRLNLSAGRDVNYSALPPGAGANLRNTYVSSSYRARPGTWRPPKAIPCSDRVATMAGSRVEPCSGTSAGI
jgi:hypothetical protein